MQVARGSSGDAGVGSDKELDLVDVRPELLIHQLVAVRQGGDSAWLQAQAQRCMLRTPVLSLCQSLCSGLLTRRTLLARIEATHRAHDSQDIQDPKKLRQEGMYAKYREVQAPRKLRAFG